MNSHILLHSTSPQIKVFSRDVCDLERTLQNCFMSKPSRGPPSTTGYCINRWSTISLLPTSDLTSWTRSAHTRPPLWGKVRNTRCVCCKRRRQGGKSPLMSSSSQVSLVPSFCPKYSDPSTHTLTFLSLSLPLEPLKTLMVNLGLFLTLQSPDLSLSTFQTNKGALS